MTLLFSVAMAQTFTEDLGLVLHPSASPLTANGIGSPSVVFDPVDQTYLMFFETRIAAADTVCPNGQWGIGVASSQDGLAWDVWPTLVAAPEPDPVVSADRTPYACVAAHPAAVYDAGTVHLWFKAEQGAFEGDGVTPIINRGWGTNNFSGIGYATVDLSLDDKTADIAAVEAAITALEASMDTAVSDFDVLLDAFETSLLAAEPEFTCLSDAPLCAPCDSVTLVAVTVGPSTTSLQRDFCQPFEFLVPDDLNQSGGTDPTNDFVRLRWQPTPKNCTEFASGAYTCSAGITPLVTIATADGNNGLSLSARSSINNQVVQGNVTLAATNLGSQTFDGPLLVTIDNLQPSTSAPDPTGITTAELNRLRNRLNTLMTWLANGGLTGYEVALHAEASNLRNEATALRNFLNASNSQLAALDTQLTDLQNYTQHVTPNVTPNAVALQINQTVGYPAVARMDGEWVMLVQRYPDLYRASGVSPDALTLDPTPIITAGTATWANQEVFESSLYCDPGSAFEYGAWVGGRRTTAGVFAQAGASDAVSTDTLSWLLNTTADFLWSSADDNRHFDVLSDSAGELRMYYVQRVGGVNEVHLRSSTTSWTHTDTLTRICPGNP